MRDSETNRRAVFELLTSHDRREKTAHLLADILLSVAVLTLIPSVSLVFDALFILSDASRLALLLAAPITSAVLILPGVVRLVRLRPDYRNLAAHIEAASPDLRSELTIWTDLETGGSEKTAVESETADTLAASLMARLPRLLPEPSNRRLKRGALAVSIAGLAVISNALVFRNSFTARLNRVLRPSIAAAIVPVRVSELFINNLPVYPQAKTVLASGRPVDVQLSFIGLPASASPVMVALNAIGETIETYPLTYDAASQAFQIKAYLTPRTAALQVRNGSDVINEYPVQFVAPPSVERIEIRINESGNGTTVDFIDRDAVATSGSTASVIVRLNRPPAYDRLGNSHKAFITWYEKGKPSRKIPLTLSGDVFRSDVTLITETSFEIGFIDEYGLGTTEAARRVIAVR
ncbi:MAG: hypothetical protein ABIH86_02380 [Planctomycetota bacterium]